MKLSTFLKGIDPNTCSRPGLFIQAGKNKWLPLSPIAKAAQKNGYKYKIGHNVSTIARQFDLNEVALKHFASAWADFRYLGYSPDKALKAALHEAKRLDVDANKPIKKVVAKAKKAKKAKASK